MLTVDRAFTTHLTKHINACRAMKLEAILAASCGEDFNILVKHVGQRLVPCSGIDYYSIVCFGEGCLVEASCSNLQTVVMIMS